MQSRSHSRKLVLASSSLYRKMLLERLGLPFEVISPNVNESPVLGETPTALVSRLAVDKAQAAALRFPAAIIMGSDQLAVCNERIVGKPGSTANAIEQLREFSGRTIRFLTAVSVLCSDNAFSYRATVVTDVHFREISIDEIRRYVEADQPLDCAGSFKSEAGGISLLRSMTSDDPTAIIGLPLIALSDGLRQAGIQIP